MPLLSEVCQSDVDGLLSKSFGFRLVPYAYASVAYASQWPCQGSALF